MYLDELPDLLYSDPLLRYVEYRAISRLVANGDDALMAARYPDVANNLQALELDFVLGGGSAVATKAEEMLRNGDFDNPEVRWALHGFYKFMENEGTVLPDLGGDDEVIETAKSVATPIRNTNAEIQKKKRDQKQIASELYQRKRLGDDAVPKALYAESRIRVDQHLLGGGTREELIPIASQLAVDNKLTEGQTDTLLNEIMLKHFDKLNHHNVIENELLSNPTQLSKSIFYLWHQLSRKYAVDVPFPLSLAEGAAMASVSKSTFPQLLKKMKEMGILKRLVKGQRGANSKRAATYRLLVSVGG